VIGHVERAWGCSFNWKGSDGEPESFKSMLYYLMTGKPVGYALDKINNRYAQIATQLNSWLDDLKWDANKDARQTSYLWLANNDARGYVLIGDPAVKLSLAAAGASPVERPVLADVASHPGSLPAVLAGEAAPTVTPPASEATGAAQPQAGAFSVIGDVASPSQPPEATAQAAAALTPLYSPSMTPIDRLALAVQAYNSAQPGPGEQLNNLAGPVADNLFKAVQSLAQRLNDATETLEVATGVVQNLDAFNPKQPDPAQISQRITTTISPSGDIQTYLPSQAQEGDQVLQALHRDLVAQAQANRLELVKVLSETIATLFGR